MLILGLSPFQHDSAAALLEDGVVKAAIENDKLVRSRNPGLPEAAIEFCRESAKAGWQELDAVAVAKRPFEAWLRKFRLRAQLSPRAPIASAYYEVREMGQLARALNEFRVLRQKAGTAAKVIGFDHHLCHAANAFYQSPFDRALVLTSDEDGDGVSGMAAVGEGTRLRGLRSWRFPHSLAWAYTQVTQLIGFRPKREEHKTQWLSLEGEPLFKEVFLEMLRRPGSPWPQLNYSFFHRGLDGWPAFSPAFYRRIGFDSQPTTLSDDQRRTLAASIQHATTEIVSQLLEHLRRSEKIERICLAGGLFQNSLLVAELEDILGIDNISVPPAPGNPGSAVGATLLEWHQVLGKPRTEPVSRVYWGPKFSRQQIKDVLDNCKARYSVQNTEARRVEAAVELLLAGKVVGWHQGAVEFGPRALGNRSVLASPWGEYVRENLNDYIKHREWFRPFAVSVAEEDCQQYFEASRNCRFMSSLARVRPDCHRLPSIFFLAGDRVRLHVVERSSNPLFWELLKRFGQHAPAPMLLNTSFNLFGEPLVVSPRDAIRSYFCSGVDALVMDHFVLSKSGVPHLVAASKPALVADESRVDDSSIGA
jgi:carbamoyltransferase